MTKILIAKLLKMVVALIDCAGHNIADIGQSIVAKSASILLLF
jgi:hypothetical protein